ncbi:KH domain-containing, RNA-binding, signal transduction-associated protein 3 [Ataeniobius toweri]|uniref:KH domain-containing, RNA-binding, signal transduction-associated protein 3 n=1 Tax=Ataeniobius toweri TaxID=208326 RepID=A0ABU7BFC3_9TELE|nr:KH domain-containing, RNA-binding, signal transduction-associated protein 3 [Ataeniobius toweri]
MYHQEEELRQSGEAKYNHLNEDLHVLIEVFAPPAEAYARMGHALEEIKKFLIPDYNDEIRQAQLQELTYLNGGSEDAKVPSVRGKSTTRGRGTPVPGPPRLQLVPAFVYLAFYIAPSIFLSALTSFLVPVEE